MILKNIKIIPFISLIDVIVLLFPITRNRLTNSDSSPCDADEVADAFYELEQYIKLAKITEPILM